MTRISIACIALLWSTFTFAQSPTPDSLILERISLLNPSFEDLAQCCEPPAGWANASINKSETPCDVQPGSFEVITPASDGNTYVGMVVRDNGTYESIGQKLKTPLKKDSCYEFLIDLCQSETYISPNRNTTQKMNYNIGVVLKLIGVQKATEVEITLAQSPVILHNDWRTYLFTFQPTISDMDYFILEANYADPLKYSYNGHILVDNASDLRMVPCE